MENIDWLYNLLPVYLYINFIFIIASFTFIGEYIDENGIRIKDLLWIIPFFPASIIIIFIPMFYRKHKKILSKIFDEIFNKRIL